MPGKFSASSLQLLLATGVLAIVQIPIAAQAASQEWILNGAFRTNVGPNPAGTFSGSIFYDDSINGGTGGWTAWNIKVFNNDPTPLLIYTFDSANATAFCFKSPLTDGGAAIGAFEWGTPASTACGGAAPPTPVGGTASNPGGPTYFAVGQIQSYTFGPPPTVVNGGDYPFNYLRIGFTGDGINTLIPNSTTNGQPWLGWSSLPFTPATDGNTPDTPGEVITTTCIGQNGNLPITNGCPYTSNQQRNQTLSESTIRVRKPEIPAPLPLAGILPLGAALKKLASRRKELLAAS